MHRRVLTVMAALTLLALASGCAGPSKLAQRSEEKLGNGDIWRAWQLATRALDKEPGNPRAREAAMNASAAIAQDWERRIHALADVDSLQAAEQVLAFADFRAQAARYVTVPVGATWPNDERAIRVCASRTHYQRGVAAMGQKRPKQAWLELDEAQRFVPDYRDAAKLQSRAFDKAVTRIAVVPFRDGTRDGGLGEQVADAWRGDLVQALTPPAAHFTRMVGGDDIAGAMRVSQLGRVSRDDAVSLARKAGADRVVWGTVGDVHAKTRLELFQDLIARRVETTDPNGNRITRWIDVPIQVVARVRDVDVAVDYEVVATRDGAPLAHQHVQRATSARVVWTSYQPEGDVGAYALVSDLVRAANPNRARDVETRWKGVCGDNTTLQQVLSASLHANPEQHYRHETLVNFMGGAAFVFLQELPPPEDLAYAALAHGGGQLRDDLLRLDTMDDVDLGSGVSTTNDH